MITRFEDFLNEAIIIPKDFQASSNKREFENNSGAKVISYEDFMKAIPKEAQSKIPSKSDIVSSGQPFFGFYDTANKQAYFVCLYPPEMILSQIPEIAKDAIRHELIHDEQINRMQSNNYTLIDNNPSFLDKKDLYFSTTEEIMALSFSIANWVKRSNEFTNAKDATNAIIHNVGKYIQNQRNMEMYMAANTWRSIANVCDESVLKKYKKYIYLYLEHFFNENED